MARYWNKCFGCLCFLSPFILLGLMVALLVLFVNPSAPSFSLHQFYLSPLNIMEANNSTTNVTIYFDLKIQNVNSAVGLHYPDPLNITFSNFPNLSTVVHLAEYMLNGFYQGNGKSRHVRDMVVTNGMPTLLDGTDFVAFRVDLVATYRYKKAGTKRHKVGLGCIVEVNYTTGEEIQSGDTELVVPGSDSQLTETVYNDY